MFDWYKKVVFENYANFNGRARRSEYWYYTLVNIIISIILMVLDNSLGLKIGSSNSGVLNSLYGLLVFIPGLAVAVRRMHDIGKSGWLLAIFYLAVTLCAIILVLGGYAASGNSGFTGLMFIPVVIILGIAIWMLILFCTEGDQGPNKFGADPKGFGEEINDIGAEQ
jgi:uncharacterized membrane protein YhaH (DUF805 family)